MGRLRSPPGEPATRRTEQERPGSAAGSAVLDCGALSAVLRASLGRGHQLRGTPAAGDTLSRGPRRRLGPPRAAGAAAGGVQVWPERNASRRLQPQKGLHSSNSSSGSLCFPGRLFQTFPVFL